MFTRTVLLALVGFVGCSPARQRPGPAAPTNATNDLFMERPRFYDADDAFYQGIVAKVFANANGFVGSCFTMVSLVEERPEEAVFGECPNDSRPALLVHVVARESIAATLKAHGVSDALLIPVKRSETTIPAKEAQRLRDYWTKTLSSAQVETGTTIREARREHFFYVLRPGFFQGFIAGVSRSPKAGSIAARFTEIGNELIDIVDASESDRAEKLHSLREALDRGDALSP